MPLCILDEIFEKSNDDVSKCVTTLTPNETNRNIDLFPIFVSWVNYLKTINKLINNALGNEIF